MNALFQRKSIEDLCDSAESGPHSLRRSLGALNLVALGIGAIIGAGLFSLTGIAAAQNAGPAVVLSFVVAAVGCAFAGMCYSELASMIPVSGSAYTYAYATMGEIAAWVIGWDLVLEYAAGAATVSVGWSGYVVKVLGTLGIDYPARYALSPFDTMKLADGTVVSGIANLPALFIIAVISLLLMRGVQESARVNAIIVAIKVAVVLAVIGAGVFYIDTANYHPFIPPNSGTFGEYGFSGIMRGAGVIFFAYIGFDAVSTTAQEARNPQRDMVRGILGSLAICTLLYILFGLVLTGLVNYRELNSATAVATAIDRTPFPFLHLLVSLGIIAGFTTVILVMLLGQSRVFFAMSRDGLLPPVFSRVHPEWRTPWLSNLLFMVLTGGVAAFVPLTNLGHMTSIGTLLAFIIACIGVIVLRKTNPLHIRGYRAPGVPVVPIAGIAVCLAMMLSLDGDTWLRLIIWLAIGLVIYFTYSRRHSRLTGTLPVE